MKTKNCRINKLFNPQSHIVHLSILFSDYHCLRSMLGGSAFIVSLQKNPSNRINFSNQNCCNIFVCHICDILPCCIHAKWKQYSEIPTVVWLLVPGNAFRRSTACHKNGSICIKLISSQVINKTLRRKMLHLTKSSCLSSSIFKPNEINVLLQV